MKQFVSNRGGRYQQEMIWYNTEYLQGMYTDMIRYQTILALPFPFPRESWNQCTVPKNIQQPLKTISDGSDVPGTYCNYGRWKEFYSRQRRGSSWQSMFFCCCKYCYFSTMTSTPEIFCDFEAWTRRSNSFHKGLSVMGRLYYYQQSPLG